MSTIPVKEENDIDNVYAFNGDFKEIYIGDVPKHENGIKKNYFCLGCKRQMQAVKGDLRKQHFKHHVKPHSVEQKCNYRDETYRHYLAKTNAIDLKKIKVPAVYKYPPDKGSDKVFRLNDAQFIEAHTVVTEKYIYENEAGEIKISTNFNEKEDKFLFFKPDAIFLDNKGKPILIIEFVATHKPDQNKLMKLKRLGVDAIQVSVPKSSPEEIRDIFFKTNRTKWLYNNEESKTNYLQFSNSYSGGIFEIDGEQRRFFEEGYKCRKAQLGDFIRTIERLLESEQYREIEQNLRSEIQRVENNTEREKSELEELRRRHSESGIKRHYQRREELTEGYYKLRTRKDNVNERFLSKAREIDEEQERVEYEQKQVDENISAIEYIINGNKQSGKSIERTIDEETESVRRLEERIAYDRNTESENIRRLEDRIEDDRNSERGKIQAIENSIAREKQYMDDLPNKFERIKENDERQIRAEEESIDREIESLEKNILGAGGKLKESQDRIREHFKGETERFIAEVESRNIGRGWAYSTDFKAMGEFRECLLADKELEERYNRLEQKNRE